MTPAVDPGREKVERGDEVLRSSQEAVIDDPTVFVKGAALGALTITELAKLALARSQEPGVRSAAEQVRTGQAALLRELGTVAGRQRLDVPKEMVFDDEQMLKSAPAARGAPFDVWFAVQTNAEFLKALSLFEVAARMKNAELAAFAKRMLPRLESDRARVTQLRMA